MLVMKDDDVDENGGEGGDVDDGEDVDGSNDHDDDGC